MSGVHRDWEPGMPRLTQEQLDARLAKIDWLRNLPFDQWPTPTIEASRIEAGCIEATKIV